MKTKTLRASTLKRLDRRQRKGSPLSEERYGVLIALPHRLHRRLCCPAHGPIGNRIKIVGSGYERYAEGPFVVFHRKLGHPVQYEDLDLIAWTEIICPHSPHVVKGMFEPVTSSVVIPGSTIRFYHPPAGTERYPVLEALLRGLRDVRAAAHSYRS